MLYPISHFYEIFPLIFILKRERKHVILQDGDIQVQLYNTKQMAKLGDIYCILCESQENMGVEVIRPQL